MEFMILYVLAINGIHIAIKGTGQKRANNGPRSRTFHVGLTRGLSE